jgi:LysM repeat protein
VRRPRCRHVRRLIGPGLLVPALLVPVLVAPASIAQVQNKPAKPHAAPLPKASSAQKTAITSKTPAPSRSATAKAGAPKPAACTHTVRSGESLSRIAARYRVSRAAVIGANDLAHPSALRIGQHLAVPGCRPRGEAGPAEARAVELVADGIVVKRVGPRRVLTELVLTAPDFQEQRIPLVWPVEGPVISTFGQRARGWHAGIDISAEIGSQVYAAAPGTVVYSGWIRSYGQVVKLEHSNGFITLYAHNLQNLVEAGEEVEAGQVIATVGRSGHTTGPHVHFEVRRDGRAYNPLHLLEPSDQTPIFEGDVTASSSDLDPHE